MKIPSDAKLNSKTIDVRALSKRVDDLYNAMIAADEAQDHQAYETYATEYNKLLTLMDSLTGYEGLMDDVPGMPETREEVLNNWTNFLASKKDNPADPYDVPPSRAPVPEPNPMRQDPDGLSITQKVKPNLFAAGGLVSLLPDSMLSSPLLNSMQAGDEMGLRSLLRATDTPGGYAEGGKVRPFVPGTIFREGSPLGNWVTRKRQERANGPSWSEWFQEGQRGVAEKLWPTPPQPVLQDAPAGTPIPMRPPARRLPSMEEADEADEQRRLQEQQKQFAEDQAAEEAARMEREQRIQDDINLLRKYYPEVPKVEYPMPDKALEDERTRHLANMQIFSSMMQAAGGDFAPIGRGFAAAGDKYEAGYDRYQKALLGKAAWDQKQAYNEYDQEAAIVGDAFEQERGRASAAAERSLKEYDKQEQRAYEEGLEGRKQAIEIRKWAMEQLLKIDPLTAETPDGKILIGHLRRFAGMEPEIEELD